MYLSSIGICLCHSAISPCERNNSLGPWPSGSQFVLSLAISCRVKARVQKLALSRIWPSSLTIFLAFCSKSRLSETSFSTIGSSQVQKVGSPLQSLSPSSEKVTSPSLNFLLSFTQPIEQHPFIFAASTTNNFD
jgi:hypothetical protein